MRSIVRASLICLRYAHTHTIPCSYNRRHFNSKIYNVCVSSGELPPLSEISKYIGIKCVSQCWNSAFENCHRENRHTIGRSHSIKRQFRIVCRRVGTFLNMKNDTEWRGKFTNLWSCAENYVSLFLFCFMNENYFHRPDNPYEADTYDGIKEKKNKQKAKLLIKESWSDWVFSLNTNVSCAHFTFDFIVCFCYGSFHFRIVSFLSILSMAYRWHLPIKMLKNFTDSNTRLKNVENHLEISKRTPIEKKFENSLLISSLWAKCNAAFRYQYYYDIFNWRKFPSLNILFVGPRKEIRL